LAALARQGGHFRRILESKKDDPIYRLAVFLDAFDIRTAYPLLLALLDAKVEPAEWEAISRILESYLLRRAVCVMNTKNYNRIFDISLGLERCPNLPRDILADRLIRALVGPTEKLGERLPLDATQI
jgi:hypothetical protein